MKRKAGFTYLECPRHKNLGGIAQIHSLYSNAEIIAAGGFIACEICETPMVPTLSEEEAAEINRRLTAKRVIHLIDEADQVMRYKCGHPDNRTPDQQDRYDRAQEAIKFLSTLVPLRGVLIIGEEKEGLGGCRAYRTAQARKRAHSILKKKGWNYFVGYKEASNHGLFPFGLTYGMSDRPYERDVRTDEPVH